MHRPTVSICMPTYNYAPYLEQAIQSALCQTYRDFELIIIDDCSTDDSRQIIRELAAADQRIIFLENASNIGMVANWNRCLQQSRGSYVKFLCADDLFASHSALQKMVHVMDSDHAISLVSSARYIVDDQTKIIDVQSHYQGIRREAGVEIIMDCLIEQQNRIGEPSVVMFRARHAGRGFSPRYKQLVDLEMWFHLLEQGYFAFIDEPLTAFRRHSAQVTTFCLATGLDIYESFLLMNDYSRKSYIKVSPLLRMYMSYVAPYRIWQRYAKHKRLERSEAIHDIRHTYNVSYAKFIMIYPIFKLIKFYRTLLRNFQKRDRCKFTTPPGASLPLTRCHPSAEPRSDGGDTHA